MADFGSAAEDFDAAYSKPREAEFSSRECPACGSRIDEGDWIVRDNADGTWIHDDCKDGAPDE